MNTQGTDEKGSTTAMSTKAQKTFLSGVKPTGRPHIGNYFGAMRQFVHFQEEYEAFVFVASYHALTQVHDAQEMAEGIQTVALDYLAIGLDPAKTTLFVQSDVSEHTELAWVFNCITTMPYLMRAHAFKDAEAKNKDITVGTFDYPLLMAADILLYDPDVVPVGDDQAQHLEFARDTAEKFNRTFGDTFSLPTRITPKDVGTVPGLDGRKMSKSYNNTIPLFATDEEVESAVAKIVTDSKGKGEPLEPDTDTVFALHALFLNADDLAQLRARYLAGSVGYMEAKEMLAESIKKFISPLRARRAELASREGYVEEVLREGAERARARASAKMRVVRARIGM